MSVPQTLTILFANEIQILRNSACMILESLPASTSYDSVRNNEKKLLQSCCFLKCYSFLKDVLSLSKPEAALWIPGIGKRGWYNHQKSWGGKDRVATTESHRSQCWSLSEACKQVVFKNLSGNSCCGEEDPLSLWQWEFHPPALHRGLRIPRCHGCDVGCSCSSDSVPAPPPKKNLSGSLCEFHLREHTYYSCPRNHGFSSAFQISHKCLSLQIKRSEGLPIVA